MADETGRDKVNIKTSTVFTMVLHSVLPISWLGFCLYVAPLFVDSLEGLSDTAGVGTDIVFAVTETISGSLVRFVMIFGCGLLADGLVYMGLLRSGKRSIAGLWSAIIVMCEIAVTVGFIAVLYLAVLRASSF